MRAGFGDALHAIGPIALTAQQMKDYKARPGHDPIDIEVDREVVCEVEIVGEAKTRRGIAQACLRRRETGKLGIGGGEQDDIAGRLAEIDRLAVIRDTAGLCRQEVHRPASRRSRFG